MYRNAKNHSNEWKKTIMKWKMYIWRWIISSACVWDNDKYVCMRFKLQCCLEINILIRVFAIVNSIFSRMWTKNFNTKHIKGRWTQNTMMCCSFCCTIDGRFGNKQIQSDKIVFDIFGHMRWSDKKKMLCPSFERRNKTCQW